MPPLLKRLQQRLATSWAVVAALKKAESQQPNVSLFVNGRQASRLSHFNASSAASAGHESL